MHRLDYHVDRRGELQSESARPLYRLVQAPRYNVGFKFTLFTASAALLGAGGRLIHHQLEHRSHCHVTCLGDLTVESAP